MSIILPPGLIGLRRKSALDVSTVFSTDLYTGNGSTQTITSGLNMSGEGGLVWLKDRTSANSNWLYDTLRGGGASISSNLTSAEGTVTGVSSFSTSGFAIGDNGATNFSGSSYVSWSFRRAAKFFDVVTYTGTGTGTTQTISHNLGAIPGLVTVKNYGDVTSWPVYHRSLTFGNSLALDSTTGQFAQINVTNLTATTFDVTTSSNTLSGTYVAYLFAQNDDLIDCGSYVGNGSATGPVVTCGSGWTPQWLLVKATSVAQDWQIRDSARNPSNPRNLYLSPNSTNGEFSTNLNFTSTGFQPVNSDQALNGSGHTYIYVAIRAAA